MSIGQRIKTIRKQRGLSIDELADKLGKNRTTVYRYENGDIENLPLYILGSLAKALNTTPAHLMGWEENERPSTEDTTPLETKYMAKWLSEMGVNKLTEEECIKVMEYAKFLLSIREN